MNARTETIDDRIIAMLREVAPATLDAERIKAETGATLREVTDALDRLTDSGHVMAIDVSSADGKPVTHYRSGPGIPDTFRPLKPRPFGARIVPRETARIPETRVDDLPPPAPARPAVCVPAHEPIGDARDEIIIAAEAQALRVQACRPEDRAMLATAAGAELVAAAAAELVSEASQRDPRSRAPTDGPADRCRRVMREAGFGQEWAASAMAQATGLTPSAAAKTLASMTLRGELVRRQGPNPARGKGVRPWCWLYRLPGADESATAEPLRNGGDQRSLLQSIEALLRRLVTTNDALVSMMARGRRN